MDSDSLVTSSNGGTNSENAQDRANKKRCQREVAVGTGMGALLGVLWMGLDYHQHPHPSFLLDIARFCIPTASGAVGFPCVLAMMCGRRRRRAREENENAEAQGTVNRNLTPSSA